MLDRYISLVLLVASGASLYNAIELAGGAGGVRGAIFPLVLTAGLGICSILLLIGTFRTVRGSSGAAAASNTAALGGAAPPAASANAGNGVTPENMRKSIFFFVLVIVFIALFKLLGFVLDAVIMGTVILRFVFKESWWQALLVSAVMAVVAYLLFQYLLMVPLPEGVLKGVLG